MPQHLFKNHWIVFRKVWTRIFFYTTILKGKNKKVVDRKREFKQILNVSRPFLVIEEDKDNFLVLTMTRHPKEKEEEDEDDWEDSEEEEKEEKPSWGRFWVKCDRCLTWDSYVRLETKILMSRNFVEFYSLRLKEDNRIEHQCLNESRFLELRKALDVYWSEENNKLTLVKLGIGGGKIKEKDKWIS
ncbi:MAG: hypothetical protein I3270_00365 [Candidatus Moeniiplasma glomeromycotorum]|nr:hypothetical protein [Candidatus Moeniiplasma glomeromycotorum]MCE8162251.1 hypothetical protein [Candidatus Moeniiplasma glomeromycotorum]MCE8166093.1 hypothetical protein [Candidatus Moeniiplasma glomeromycotorum]MCE8166650.1 hypothetical protein [Candidatus Moeniiplasma glomeromycotorum]